MQFEVKPNKKLRKILLPYIITFSYFECFVMYVIGFSLYAIIRGIEGVSEDVAYLMIGAALLTGIPLAKVLWVTCCQCYNRYIFCEDSFIINIGNYKKMYKYSDITSCLYERYGNVDKSNSSKSFTIQIKKKSCYLYLDYHTNFIKIYDWLMANQIEVTGDEISECEFVTLNYEEAINKKEVLGFGDIQDKEIAEIYTVKPKSLWMLRNYVKPMIFTIGIIYLPYLIFNESLQAKEKIIILVIICLLATLLIGILGWLLKKEYYIEEEGIVIKTLLKKRKYSYGQLEDVAFDIFSASRAHKMTSELSFYVGSKKYWLYGHDYDNLEGFVKMLNTKIKVVTR